MPNTLSLRGYGIVRTIDLSTGVRPHVPPAPQISIRALLTAALPKAPTLTFGYDAEGIGDYVSWNHDGGVTGFELQLQTDGQTWNLLSNMLAANAYQGVADWGNHYTYHENWNPFYYTFLFRVRVRNAIGFGPWSNIAHAPPPPPPPMPKVSFDIIPNHGYLNQFGDWCTLTWSIQSDIPFSASFSSNPTNAVGIKSVGASGTLNIQPKDITDVMLTASNSSGSTSVERTISFYKPGLPTGTGQYFYFRMTGPSVVTPCFSMAIFAADVQTATHEAETQNGGFNATQISEQQFEDGSACP